MPSRDRLPVAALAAALTLALAAPAFAQSLADVARKEGERRKEQPKAGKVYTNEALRRDFTASTTPEVPDAQAAASTGASEETSPEPSASPGPKKDEAYWKGRITSVREELERAQAFGAALESQISGLTVDFVNRDDPAQRAAIETKRQKAVAEYERVLRAIEGHKKAIAAVEDDARKAGVPAGWLR